MQKARALQLLGGTQEAAAAAIGITQGAVAQWPDRLPARLEDRVVAAIARRLLRPETLGLDDDVVAATTGRADRTAAARQQRLRERRRNAANAQIDRAERVTQSVTEPCGGGSGRQSPSLGHLEVTAGPLPPQVPESVPQEPPRTADQLASARQALADARMRLLLTKRGESG